MKEVPVIKSALAEGRQTGYVGAITVYILPIVKADFVLVQ